MKNNTETGLARASFEALGLADTGQAPVPLAIVLARSGVLQHPLDIAAGGRHADLSLVLT